MSVSIIQLRLYMIKASPVAAGAAILSAASRGEAATIVSATDVLTAYPGVPGKSDLSVQVPDSGIETSLR